jgi:hypothetical protein
MRPARKKILETVRRIKDETPCMDCEVRYPYYTVHFDHVRGEKVDTINRMVYTSSMEKVLEEIAKCDVVCANCHHIRTYMRKFIDSNYKLREFV